MLKSQELEAQIRTLDEAIAQSQAEIAKLRQAPEVDHDLPPAQLAVAEVAAAQDVSARQPRIQGIERAIATLAQRRDSLHQAQALAIASEEAKERAARLAIFYSEADRLMDRVVAINAELPEIFQALRILGEQYASDFRLSQHHGPSRNRNAVDPILWASDALLGVGKQPIEGGLIQYAVTPLPLGLFAEQIKAAYAAQNHLMLKRLTYDPDKRRSSPAVDTTEGTESMEEAIAELKTKIAALEALDPVKNYRPGDRFTPGEVKELWDARFKLSQLEGAIA